MTKENFLEASKTRYKKSIEKVWVSEMSFIYSPKLILRVWFDHKANNHEGEFMHRWSVPQDLIDRTSNQTFARKCDVTGEGMNEGYVFGDGTDYFKYEKDALAHAISLGYKDLQESYDDDAHYYTEWEEEDDREYELVNGTLIEIN